MGCVYEIYNELNGRCYIGVTSRTAQERWKEHIRNSEKGSQTVLSRAIRKYGSESFTTTPIIISDHRDNLFVAERAMVAAYRASGHNLYNMTDGGDGAFSEEAFENNRKANTKRLKEQWQNSDYREKMIELSKKQWTDEKKQAASERMKALYSNDFFGLKWLEKSRKQKLMQRLKLNAERRNQRKDIGHTQIEKQNDQSLLQEQRILGLN